MRQNMKIYIVVMLLSVPSVWSLSSCMKGTYMLRHGSGDDVCHDCEKGTYMPHENHTNRSCYNCTEIKDPKLEVLIQECDLEKDTVIHCKHGYYRHGNRNGRTSDYCKSCTECESKTKLCSNYTDTVCCLSNYDAVEVSPGVFQCEERPTVCSCGQYFIEEKYQCMTCPPGTYMPESNHTHKSCIKCEVQPPGPEYNISILQLCGSCSPALFGCQKGYFRYLNTSLMLPERCQICTCDVDEKTLRNCSEYDKLNCLDEKNSAAVSTKPKKTNIATPPSMLTSGTTTPDGKNYEVKESCHCSETTTIILGVILGLVGVVTGFLVCFFLRKEHKRLNGGANAAELPML